MFKPFVINSNIVTSQADVETFEAFMNATARNIGNSYITYSLLKELGLPLSALEGHEIKSVYTYNFAHDSQKDIDTINNECTHILLMLQDQIRIQESYGFRLPFKQLTDFLKQTKCPIIIAGLGANSFDGYKSDFYTMLDEEQVTFWRYISTRCAVIGLRGSFTEEVLHNIGVDNTQVIGCPTYYERGANRKIEKRKWHDNMKLSCSSGFSTKLTNAVVYLQDMQEEERIRQIAYHADGIVKPTLYDAIINKRFRIFSSMSSWRNDLADKDFFWGYRMHGAMVALNSEVPVVVLNHDSRSREMCEFMNIPYYPGYIIDSMEDVEKLYQMCDYARMNTEYHGKLSDYEAFLNKNGLSYAPLQDSIHKIDLALYSDLHVRKVNIFEDIVYGISKNMMPKSLNRKLRALYTKIVKRNK